ncbi:unnamed protein product [Heterobilharzia americana]|nr:unnamed protein product [Heterobilharzia americana]
MNMNNWKLSVVKGFLYEDTAPTTPTTTTNSNHHQRKKLKRSNLLHLSRKLCFNYRRHTRGCQIRIGKARQAFISLKPVWRSSALSMWNKIPIFNTNVKSVLLYGSETWRVTKGISNKLQTFINNCLCCLVTEDQMARKNKQQGALGTNQPRTYHATNMQWKGVEMDWAYTEKATEDITRQARPSSGIPMGSDELGVRGDGDMEEVVRGGNERLWAVVEPGSKDFREQSSLETCYCSPMFH